MGSVPPLSPRGSGAREVNNQAILSTFPNTLQSAPINSSVSVLSPRGEVPMVPFFSPRGLSPIISPRGQPLTTGFGPIPGPSVPEGPPTGGPSPRGGSVGLIQSPPGIPSPRCGSVGFIPASPSPPLHSPREKTIFSTQVSCPVGDVMISPRGDGIGVPDNNM